MERFASEKAQSLIEVLIGIALGALFVIGTATIIAPSLQTNTGVIQVQVRAQLANELAGNVRSWAAGNWNSVLSLATGTSRNYYLGTATSSFSVASGTELITINSQAYNRFFYVNDVYRDSNGNVTTTISGNSYDPSTKLISIFVAASSTQLSASTSIAIYVTRNTDNIMNQTSWAGSSSQNSAVTMIGTGFATSSNISITASGSLQLAPPPGGACVL